MREQDFGIATFEVRVIPPICHENSTNKPLILLTSRNDDGERRIKIPWDAWRNIVQVTMKAGNECLADVMTITLQEHK